ncbi:MAG: EAL domain-containing protein [Candidatus Obscuribacterales bacterium]|nr:EAL domain-containing protein [Steroidobacteraceae bacterium]
MKSSAWDGIKLTLDLANAGFGARYVCIRRQLFCVVVSLLLNLYTEEHKVVKPRGIKWRFIGYAILVSLATAALIFTLQTLDYQYDQQRLESFAGQLPELRDQLRIAQRDDFYDWIWTLVAVCAFIAGLVLMVAWVFARRLERPIVELIVAAREIGEGVYNHPLTTLTSDDEIADLQVALEQMRQKLQQTTITTNYLNTVLNSMQDAVLVIDQSGAISKINQGAVQLFNCNESELVGRQFVSLLTEQERALFSIESGANETVETLIETADGQTIPVSVSISALSTANSELNGAILVARNITERKRAERRIRYLARYDALTKIPNRMQFQHMLQQAIARARRSDQGVVLLYLDLDRFKEINDTFGHAAGDRTLETLSERLARLLPKEAVLGRLAGDEFALFIEGIAANDDEKSQAAILARMILTEIAKAFYVQQHELFLTASIGISLCPKDAENVIDLIRNADAAMYHSKQNGGNSFAFYSPEMNAAAVERLMLKSKLRRALERDEFVVLYQPKVDLRNGRIVGAEALLRWRLPGHGDIPPTQFIPLAEETNLILGIGDWVMNRVCSDYRLWLKQIANPGRVSINLSLKQLRQASFVTRCRSVFKRHEVSPTCFELEITETTLMADTKRTLKMLDELYAMGLHLSIDDFGTGYSSLSALQQFPISTLKIDKSFVRDIPHDTDDATIARTIVDMGRSMDMEVIAEGVETREQMDFLRAHGCHYAQGRLFGEPMTGDDFLALVISQEMGAASVSRLFA